MPSPKYRGRLAEKSMSFHGKDSSVMIGVPGQLRRPKTLPDLRGGGGGGGGGGGIVLPQATGESAKRLTKLLLKVTLQGSVGAVQVLINPESTVADLIAATLAQYAKEGRRPVLSSSNPASFHLHYSQFSLQSLEREEKLVMLGSRSFFLCNTSVSDPTPPSAASCSGQAEKVGRFGLPWLKFIGLMQ